LRETNDKIKNYQRILILAQRYEEQYKQQKKSQGQTGKRSRNAIEIPFTKSKESDKNKITKKKNKRFRRSLAEFEYFVYKKKNYIVVKYFSRLKNEKVQL
jgi:hypothetical protein